MKGTRPFDNDEIRRISGCFAGTFEVRNRGFLMLDVSTGGRISELLSLRYLLSSSFRFLGRELKQTAGETLFLEIALRGYDLSKLREDTERLRRLSSSAEK